MRTYARLDTTAMMPSDGQPAPHRYVPVVHGTEDRTVPRWHGEMIFTAAPEPKFKLIVEGAYHSNVIEVAGPRYWDALQACAATLSG